MSWPERAVAMQNSAVVLATIVAALLLLVLVDALGSATLTWIRQ